jgi:hypothetical protein
MAEDSSPKLFRNLNHARDVLLLLRIERASLKKFA